MPLVKIEHSDYETFSDRSESDDSLILLNLDGGLHSLWVEGIGFGILLHPLEELLRCHGLDSLLGNRDLRQLWQWESFWKKK